MAREVRVVHRRPTLIRENAMNHQVKTAPEDTAIAIGAFAQSAVVPIDNEPTPRLRVEAPLPGPLARASW